MTSPSASDPSARATVVRTPRDLLAVAPAVLGYWPNAAVVMLTFGGPRSFHAHLGLPDVDLIVGAEGADARVVGEVVAELAGPAERHGARSVALLYYTEHGEVPSVLQPRFVAALEAAGIELVTALRAAGGRYWRLPLDGSDRGGRGTPYDVRDHPLVLEAQLAGRLGHTDRAGLVASLEPDADGVEAVGHLLERSGLVDLAPPADAAAIRASGAWVEALVRSRTLDDEVPDDAEIARLVWAMGAVRVRDAAWAPLARGTAAAHVRLWTHVLRRCPERFAAPPATLLAWAAWQMGDGARAWIALDRAQRADPAYRLAGLLEHALRGAVDPRAWEGGFDWAAGLGAA